MVVVGVVVVNWEAHHACLHRCVVALRDSLTAAGDWTVVVGRLLVSHSCSMFVACAIPDSQATSAYIGNGAVGLRVASEPGEGGVLRLFVDNVMLGAGNMRIPTGYFRLIVNGTAAHGAPIHPLRVSLHQHIHDAHLTGTVTDIATGAEVLSLEAFVQADYDPAKAASGAVEGQGAIALQLRWEANSSSNSVTPSGPRLEWVAAANVTPRFVWNDKVNHTEGTLTAFASVVTTRTEDAAAVVKAAMRAGWVAERERSAKWWVDFWPQAFLTLPTTRLEGYYYVEIYRFAASDRTTLHGLMGAFGPTGIFNLWPVRCLWHRSA